MGKRTPVQGWPFALVHACAANTHHTRGTNISVFDSPDLSDCPYETKGKHKIDFSTTAQTAYELGSND